MALLENHIQVTMNELENNLSLFKLEDYITQCEEVFDRRVEEIADRVIHDGNIRAIFISGPSASGKTTFNSKLGRFLNDKEIGTVKMSLDDYYFSHEFKTDEFGRHDYESIDTLDTDLMLSQISGIISGQTISIPYFDFMTKARILSKARETKLADRGVLLVEGLHGLSGAVAGAIDKDRWLGVFIMPYATLNDDYRLLDSRDIRILRRVARDALNRGADALATIDYWPMLDRAEQSSFPEYLRNADVYLNSAMPYEFYCIAPLAGGMIAKSLEDHKNGILYKSRLTVHGGLAQAELALAETERLYKATCKIPQIGIQMVPAGSLLNEFIRKE
ncbi:MAG: nucleoside/nucleotide kinase family protein [Saccharofermentanales bacterium]